MKQLLLTSFRQTYRFAVPFILNRGEFPFILNQRGLLGEGAEIGVKHGQFSEYLLEHWHGKTLYSIDAWKEFPDDEYHDGANVSQAEQDQIYANTCARLEHFKTRSSIIRGMSVETASRFEDGQLDFVYLDAAHDYENVVADLNAWAPKIRKGGILSGHDYMDAKWASTDFGVKAAVDEYAQRHNLKVKVSMREPHNKSFFIFI